MTLLSATFNCPWASFLRQFLRWNWELWRLFSKYKYLNPNCPWLLEGFWVLYSIPVLTRIRHFGKLLLWSPVLQEGTFETFGLFLLRGKEMAAAPPFSQSCRCSTFQQKRSVPGFAFAGSTGVGGSGCYSFPMLRGAFCVRGGAEADILLYLLFYRSFKQSIFYSIVQYHSTKIKPRCSKTPPQNNTKLATPYKQSIIHLCGFLKVSFQTEIPTTSSRWYRGHTKLFSRSWNAFKIQKLIEWILWC